MGPMLLCAAIEPFEGVPDVSRAVQLAEVPGYTPLQANPYEQTAVSGWRGAHMTSLGQKVASWELSTRLAGPGSAGRGILVGNGELLRAGGWEQRVFDSDGYAYYRPSQFPQESAVIAYFVHPNYDSGAGTRFLGRNCRGTVGLRFPAGEYGMLACSMMGGYRRPLSSQDIQVATFPPNVYRLAQITGQAAETRAWLRHKDGTLLDVDFYGCEVNQPNNIQPNEFYNQMEADVRIENDRADITARLEVGFVNEDVHRYFQAATDNGWFGLKLLSGSNAGDVLGFRMKRFQPINVTVGERNGIPTTVLEGNVVGHDDGTGKAIEECVLASFTQSRDNIPDEWKVAAAADVYTPGAAPSLTYKTLYIPASQLLTEDATSNSGVFTENEQTAANGFPIQLDTSGIAGDRGVVLAHRLDASGGYHPTRIIAGAAGSDYREIGKLVRSVTVSVSDVPYGLLFFSLSEDPGAACRVV